MPDGGLPPVDPDLTALATQRGKDLKTPLREILREVRFNEVNRDLRLPQYGGDYDIRPFPLPGTPVDTHEMRRRLRGAVKAARGTAGAGFARRIQHAFSLFMFGHALNREALEELFGESRRAALDEAFALGLLVNADGQAARTNELSLFSMTLHNGRVLHLFADTPPHFEPSATRQRVYAGADSYELVDKVSAAGAISGYCVETGSGSGIQLIAALAQYPAITKAIGLEIDRRARHVSLFNAALNGVDDRLVIVQDDQGLRQALDGQPIAFAMSNPPFLAMPAEIDIDGEARLDVRASFPAAGWGGEDGLAVTKEFIDALFPLLATDSKLVIYSQFAGDRQGPAVLQADVQARGGWRFAFEPARSRRVFSAGESALLVARLIVAALKRTTDPGNLRTKVAGRIEQSYQRQGITHFHDGFAMLTKVPTV